jgi:hypothetical protein
MASAEGLQMEGSGRVEDLIRNAVLAGACRATAHKWPQYAASLERAADMHSQRVKALASELIEGPGANPAPSQ